MPLASCRRLMSRKARGQSPVSALLDHPGKARRRTPRNWRDFQTLDISRGPDGWDYEPAGNGKEGRDRQAAKLTAKEAAWLNDIKAVFKKDVGGEELALGEPFKLSRDALREGLKAAGCFELGERGAICNSDRQKLLQCCPNWK